MRGSRVVLLVACLVLTSLAVPRAGEGPSPYAAWSFGSLGMEIGLGGIAIGGSGSQTEVYVGSRALSDGYFWYSLRYHPETQKYEQSFVSETLPAQIVHIAPFHTPVPDRPLAIVVAMSNATRIYDPVTKTMLGTDAASCSTGTRGNLAAMNVRDIDGDGWDEFILLCRDGTVVVHGFTYPEWVVPGATWFFSAADVAVAQMDDDPALEIATSDGRVIDAATRAVQWTDAGAFGDQLQAADIDADGRAELIGMKTWTGVNAYDVERQLPKWSMPDTSVGAILVTDVEGDGGQDLLVGDGLPGSVLRSYNPQTLVQQWFIPTTASDGVNRIAFGDVNNDGVKELLWSGGAASSGPDRLYVGNWAARTVAWESPQLDGPFLGPEVGDLDGDGIAEFAFASSRADAGRSSGRIVVADGRTLDVRAISAGVASAFDTTYDLKVRDLNGDGRREILAVSEHVVEGYSFSAANVFTKSWTTARRTDTTFHAVEVADVDGNGDLEVVVSSVNYVYAYDAATGAEEWKSPKLGTTTQSVLHIAVGPMDGDPALEIAGLLLNGEVWVVDGVTRTVQTSFSANGSSIAMLDPAYGIGSLLVGTAAGHVGAWGFNGTTFTESIGWNFGTARINSARLSDGALAVVSGGVMHVLREGTIFDTANYGPGLTGPGLGFSPSLLSFGNGRVIFSGGGHGVHAFIVHP